MKYLSSLLLVLFSCNTSTDNILVRNTGETQGSYYHIKYISKGGVDYQIQIDSILSVIDSSLSIYQDYSLISKLNKGEEVKTDIFFNSVYKAAERVYNETNGSFDCSIYPLVEYWGFYTYPLKDTIIIDSLEIRKMLSNTDFGKIRLVNDSLFLPKGMRLDFNSLAQGYTVDIIASFLEQKGVGNYLIEIGGELLAKGINVKGDIWTVGVDKPTNNIDANQRFLFILELENKALATSGNYRKFYEKDGVKYSHTIDPISGFPAQNKLLSVTVIHDNCMLADAYATAFMVMGVKRTKEFILNNNQLEVYLVYTGKNGAWKEFISPSMYRRIIN